MSLSQKRAKFALDRIRELEAMGQAAYDNYRGAVRALPATIMTSSLGQALAIELAAGTRDKGRKFLFKHLDAWLRNDEGKGWPSSPYRGAGDVLTQMMGGREKDYLRAQEEAMLLLIWLKKFAEAFLLPPAADKADKADAGERP